MTGFQGLAGQSRRRVCVSCIWSVSHRQRSDFGGCEKEGEAGGGEGGEGGGGGERVNRSFGITRDRNGFTLLIALLLVTCCWNMSTAEVIFHRRDHRDQGEIYPSQRNFLVRNYGDALVSWLVHLVYKLYWRGDRCEWYSYVNCFMISLRNTTLE